MSSALRVRVRQTLRRQVFGHQVLRHQLHARTRLTLWYTLLLAGSMIVLGSIALWAIDRELWVNFDEMLHARASVLESDLQHDVGHFTPEDAQEADALGVNLDVVREWDRNGKLLYSRTGSARDLAAGITLPDAPATGKDVFSEEHLADGRTVRLLSRNVADHGRTLGYVQAGLATDEVGRIVDRLRVLGGVGLLLALLVAGAGGWFLAGQALGPIDRITRAAERIGADDLSGRLGLQLPDDELGRLAHAFDGMIARLEGAFERQRRFTADASHELRTPLGVIRSQSEVALSRPRSVEYYERVLGSIRDETGRLTRLAESLLMLARADAAEAVALQELDFQNLVGEVGAGVAPRAREAQVHLAVRLDDCPPIRGNETWLTQLLLNLLDNALQHTPAGGRVTLSLSSAHEGVIVQVADTGEGIAAEHLPHLFERFYRADEARTRSAGGAGLGLAICQWIAQAHGGKLSVGSVPGAGTTVTLWLPATDRAAVVDAVEAGVAGATADWQERPPPPDPLPRARERGNLAGTAGLSSTTGARRA